MGSRTTAPQPYITPPANHNMRSWRSWPGCGAQAAFCRNADWGFHAFPAEEARKKQEIPKPRVPLVCATGRHWALVCPLLPPLFMGGPFVTASMWSSLSLLSYWRSSRAAEQPLVSLFPVWVCPPRGSSESVACAALVFSSSIVCFGGSGHALRLGGSGPGLLVPNNAGHRL